MLQTVKDLVLAAGFEAVGVLNPADCRQSEAVRTCCEQNRCGRYGSCWACPPGVGSLAECRRRVLEYEHLLLFCAVFSLDDPFDIEGMGRGLQAFTRRLDRLADSLAPLPMRFLLFGGEGCDRCERCTYPAAACRHPERLRPSLEGYGFTVSELARQAGLRYYNGEKTVTYFGALLCAEQ